VSCIYRLFLVRLGRANFLMFRNSKALSKCGLRDVTSRFGVEDYCNRGFKIWMGSWSSSLWGWGNGTVKSMSYFTPSICMKPMCSPKASCGFTVLDKNDWRLNLHQWRPRLESGSADHLGFVDHLSGGSVVDEDLQRFRWELLVAGIN
jgi:hypothetical protein